MLINIPKERVQEIQAALKCASDTFYDAYNDEERHNAANCLDGLWKQIQVHSLLQSGGQLDTTEVHTVGDVHLLLTTIVALAHTKLEDPPTQASRQFWSHLTDWIENELLNVEVYQTWLSGRVF